MALGRPAPLLLGSDKLTVLSNQPPIYLLVGPPAAGKTTLAKAILKRYPFGIHLPVDDLREFVVSGLAHPFPWTEETTRQFRLAESAAADNAKRYHEAGFAVVVDHIAELDQLDRWAEAHFPNLGVRKIVLLPPLELLQQRNRSRVNKDFDPEVLAPHLEGIRSWIEQMAENAQGWEIFSNEYESPEILAGLLTAGTT